MSKQTGITKEQIERFLASATGKKEVTAEIFGRYTVEKYRAIYGYLNRRGLIKNKRNYVTFKIINND